MTDHDDAFFRSTLGVLDGEVAAESEFERRLEHDLLERLAGTGRDGRRSHRRWLVAVAAVVVVVVGTMVLLDGDEQRTRTADPTDTSIPTTPSPTTPTSGTTTSEPEATTVPADESAGLAAHQIEGVLPDGTSYSVNVERATRTTVEGISGVIVMDIDGGVNAIGVTNFQRQRSGATDGVTVENNIVTARSNGWVMIVQLYDHVIDALEGIDPNIERVLTQSISVGGGGSTPWFSPTEPFRWAEDHELPLAMQVMYGEYVVRRGCGEDAVACSDRRGVQVIPIDQVVAPASPVADNTVWIDSRAARPTDDPNWLDPGPLSARGGHQVMWTGAEMIVWGGATGDRASHLTDGAAYDPDTGRWRTLAVSPFDDPTVTTAVWADDEMLVVASDRTVAYDPGSNSWREVGDGISVGETTWGGNSLIMVNSRGAFRFDRDDGDWHAMPAGPFSSVGQAPDPWNNPSLLQFNGELYARDGCSTEVWRWDGTEWQPLPDLPETIATSTAFAFCPAANQWAATPNGLVIWESDLQPTVLLDPRTNRWREIDRIPVPGTEGPGGALVVGDRVMAIVSGAAMLDPDTMSWSEVTPPGAANGSDMVWTGDEILMWGGTCCYGAANPAFTIDAWRWAPP